MNKILELLPAIDVADGKAVRLVRGQTGTEEEFGAPLEVAESFVSGGAGWLHLVDLDAAFGRGNNRKLIAEVVAQTKNVKIQLSGGIRDEESLMAALEMGATRVNLATNALDDLSFVESAIERFADQVAVGLDVKGTTLTARGSKHASGDLFEIFARLEAAGCARYIVTDVTKDGTLRGPNFDLLRRVLQRTDRPVVTSGGLASLQDITDLRALVNQGLEGAILGKALYARQFTLQEALEIATAK